MPLDNPNHALAAGAYAHYAKEGAESQRELEASVLLKAAARLEALQGEWEKGARAALPEVLAYNRKLWLVFYDSALEREEEAKHAPQPPEGSEAGVESSVRKNMIVLARYVFRREVDILAAPDPEKLDILISINRNIAAGLMGETG
ncbi:MAG: flagellar FlaF family protein [Alphaproteobacteria bacterium]|nr:flagellar FlaF family protein [Alphaproteobacteria bacterium]